MEGAGANRGIFDRFAGLLQALRPSVPNQQLQVEDHTLPTAGQQGRGYGDAAAAAAALQAAGKFSDGVAAASQPARGLGEAPLLSAAAMPSSLTWQHQVPPIAGMDSYDLAASQPLVTFSTQSTPGASTLPATGLTAHPWSPSAAGAPVGTSQPLVTPAPGATDAAADLEVSLSLQLPITSPQQHQQQLLQQDGSQLVNPPNSSPGLSQRYPHSSQHQVSPAHNEPSSSQQLSTFSGACSPDNEEQKRLLLQYEISKWRSQSGEAPGDTSSPPAAGAVLVGGVGDGGAGTADSSPTMQPYGPLGASSAAGKPKQPMRRAPGSTPEPFSYWEPLQSAAAAAAGGGDGAASGDGARSNSPNEITAQETSPERDTPMAARPGSPSLLAAGYREAPAPSLQPPTSASPPPGQQQLEQEAATPPVRPPRLSGAWGTPHPLTGGGGGGVDSEGPVTRYVSFTTGRASGGSSGCSSVQGRPAPPASPLQSVAGHAPGLQGSPWGAPAPSFQPAIRRRSSIGEMSPIATGLLPISSTAQLQQPQQQQLQLVQEELLLEGSGHPYARSSSPAADMGAAAAAAAAAMATVDASMDPGSPLLGPISSSAYDLPLAGVPTSLGMDLPPVGVPPALDIPASPARPGHISLPDIPVSPGQITFPDNPASPGQIQRLLEDLEDAPSLQLSEPGSGSHGAFATGPGNPQHDPQQQQQQQQHMFQTLQMPPDAVAAITATAGAAIVESAWQQLGSSAYEGVAPPPLLLSSPPGTAAAGSTGPTSSLSFGLAAASPDGGGMYLPRPAHSGPGLTPLLPTAAAGVLPRAGSLMASPGRAVSDSAAGGAQLMVSLPLLGDPVDTGAATAAAADAAGAGVRAGVVTTVALGVPGDTAVVTDRPMEVMSVGLLLRAAPAGLVFTPEPAAHQLQALEDGHDSPRVSAGVKRKLDSLLLEELPAADAVGAGGVMGDGDAGNNQGGGNPPLQQQQQQEAVGGGGDQDGTMGAGAPASMQVDGGDLQQVTPAGDTSSKRQRTQWQPPAGSTTASSSRMGWTAPAAAAMGAECLQAQTAAAMSLSDSLVQAAPVNLLAQSQQEQGMGMGGTPVAAGGQQLQLLLGQCTPEEALTGWRGRESEEEAAGGDGGVPGGSRVPPPPPATAAALEGHGLHSAARPAAQELLMVAPALTGPQAVPGAGRGPGRVPAAAAMVAAADTQPTAAAAAGGGGDPEWDHGRQQSNGTLEAVDPAYARPGTPWEPVVADWFKEQHCSQGSCFDAAAVWEAVHCAAVEA